MTPVNGIKCDLCGGPPFAVSPGTEPVREGVQRQLFLIARGVRSRCWCEAHWLAQFGAKTWTPAGGDPDGRPIGGADEPPRQLPREQTDAEDPSVPVAQHSGLGRELQVDRAAVTGGPVVKAIGLPAA